MPSDTSSSLIQLHESLLFQRAYPASPALLRKADRELFAFARRIDRLRATGADLSPFEDPTVSGIAGTSLSAVFSYEVARLSSTLVTPAASPSIGKTTSILRNSAQCYATFCRWLRKTGLLSQRALIAPGSTRDGKRPPSWAGFSIALQPFP